MSRADWVRKYATKDKIECVIPPFKNARIRVGYKSVTAQWLSCCSVNGDPKDGQVPVRTCGVKDCVNGFHHRWGDMEDAQRARIFSPRQGSHNPNAKLSELEVSQLLAVNWGNGRFKAQAAEAAGIKPATLSAILDRRIWQSVEPYVSSDLTGEGDEF